MKKKWIFALIIIIILFILLIVVFSAFFGSSKVIAKMNAENAAFTCSNNVIKFMDFEVPGESSQTYEDHFLVF